MCPSCPPRAGASLRRLVVSVYGSTPRSAPLRSLRCRLMTGAVDALLARIGPGFFQQAFVVTDLDAAMAAFTEHAGCATWTTFPAIGTPYRYRGRDIESSVSLGFSRSGRVQIELIQPLDGEGLTHDF